MRNLRIELLASLADQLDHQQLQQVAAAIDAIIDDFNITEKSTDLMCSTNNNMIILKNFLGTKILEGRSKATIAQYKLNVGMMFREIDKPVTDISTNDIRRYLANYQITHSVAMITLDNMRSYLNAFFNWLALEGYVDNNPMARIAPFKVPKKHIHALSDRDMEKLRCACSCVRDRALIEFLYSTGARVSECSAVNFEDLHMSTGTVTITHGKGGKEAICYLSDIATMWLESYIKERGLASGPLWLGKRGRLSKSGIEAMVTRLAEKSGVVDATPHKFRHTLGTNLVKHGARLESVQKILRHSDISTTMVYVDVDDSDVQRTHTRYLA